MTYHEDFTLPAELLEQVQAEGSEHLNAGPYQHSEERRGYANGYKPKTIRTRVGDILSWARTQERMSLGAITYCEYTSKLNTCSQLPAESVA